MRLALITVGVIFLSAIFGPLLLGYEYDMIDFSQLNVSPNLKHPFGTDDLGRDLFTRIWWGARISLFIGFIAAIIDLFIGVIFGSIAAFFGGKIDEMMMRLCDILYSVPYILTVILLITIFGTGLFSIVLALTITGWINMARIIRTKLMEVRQRDFVLAAIAIGSSRSRIIFHHLIPHSAGVMITHVTYTIPTAIFTESFLSFLGLGVQAPKASWGVLMAEGVDALQYYPWRLFFPALLMGITVYAFNHIGDHLKMRFSKR